MYITQRAGIVSMSAYLALKSAYNPKFVKLNNRLS